jgi:hypothetical protein
LEVKDPYVRTYLGKKADTYIDQNGTEKTE